MRTLTVYKVVYTPGGDMLSYSWGALPAMCSTIYRPNVWVEAPIGYLFAFDSFGAARRYCTYNHLTNPLLEVWRAQAVHKIRLDFASMMAFSYAGMERHIRNFWQQAEHVLTPDDIVPGGCIRTPAGTIGVKRMRLEERMTV